MGANLHAIKPLRHPDTLVVFFHCEDNISKPMSNTAEHVSHSEMLSNEMPGAREYIPLSDSLPSHQSPLWFKRFLLESVQTDEVTEKLISEYSPHFMQMFLVVTYHLILKSCPLNELRKEEELENCSLIHDSCSSCTYDNGSGPEALGKTCILGRKMPGQYIEISFAAMHNLWLNEHIYRYTTDSLSFQKSMK